MFQLSAWSNRVNLYTNIFKRKLLWSREQSQSTAVIRDIFRRTRTLFANIESEYNTVRNEIRRIDNFVAKEIRRREKNINWIVEYTHPGITIKATGIKRDSSTNFFIFLPPLNLQRNLRESANVDLMMSCSSVVLRT